MRERGEGWSAEARAACGDLYAEIAALPFLRELEAGTLGAEAFSRYLREDGLYLGAYAQAMRRLAERLPEGPERALFVHFAEDGVEAERAMQAEFGAGEGGGEEDAACRRLMAHVAETAEAEDLPVALAGVLPCFAVYAEVGARLARSAGDGHPYRRWIGTYAGGDFAGDAAAVAALCDEYARRQPACRPAMDAAYREGVCLERDFWAAAR
jgi:thiaminase